MWNAFVQRRNGGGYDDERALLELIELNDDDCKLLIAAGLKIQKGASPRDLYCFQNLPSFYDGTPLQVLRLLEEMRSAGRRKVRKADAARPMETITAKRQRVSKSADAASGLLPAWARSKASADVDEGLLEISEGEQLPDVITIRSSSVKRPPSPTKRASGADLYETVASPVKPFVSTKHAGRRSSMQIDVVSVEKDISSTTPPSRKRKSGSESSSSASPITALFSPTKNIRTPSPGLKTKRTSVLKQFETPEQQSTGSKTPQTVPAPPKRFSTVRTQYTITTTTTSDTDDEQAELRDGLLDDSPEDDERACCDVKSVMEPIVDAWQRTSSRFQHAWEEVRGLSSSLVLIPLNAELPKDHGADVLRDDDLLVLEGATDQPNEVTGKTDGLCVQTRRQHRTTSRSGSLAVPWRLW